MAILIREILPMRIEATSCDVKKDGLSHNRFFTHKEREIVKRLGFREVYVTYDGEAYEFSCEDKETDQA